MLALVVLAALVAAPPPAAPDLVGAWGTGGQPFIVFAADGTGTMDGEPFSWRASKGVLVLTAEGESEQVAYEVQGDALVLNLGGFPMSLERMGTTGRAPARAAPPLPPAPAGAAPLVGGAGPGAAVGGAGPPSLAAPAADKPDPREPLAKLLLGSAWCSFTFNKTTGASSSSRYVFGADGTWSMSRDAETYNSGPYGSVAGQYGSGAGGRWTVKKGQLFLSAPPEQPTLVPVPVAVTKNSSGYPIIHADGTEYSMCR